MDIRSIVHSSNDIITERDIKNGEKLKPVPRSGLKNSPNLQRIITKTTSRKVAVPKKELFSINPVHRYTTLGMTNFHVKGEWTEDVPLIKELDLSEGRGYRIERIKVGNKILLKKVRFVSEPKVGNKVRDGWSLIRILNEECPPSWENVFKVCYKDLNDVNTILEREKSQGNTICPPKKYIFRAFELCPLSTVKVVIIGMDPYHTVRESGPVANGLCFSTTTGIQPSLRNVYKNLENSYPNYKTPEHGDLSSWTTQGVLMINAALTTIEGKSGAHLKYWKGFTLNIIHALNKLRPYCIYLLWGKPAQEFKKKVHNHNLVLESRHPSSMANSSYVKDKFENNGHFIKANTLLEGFSEKPIDWRIY